MLEATEVGRGRAGGRRGREGARYPCQVWGAAEVCVCGGVLCGVRQPGWGAGEGLGLRAAAVWGGGVEGGGIFKGWQKRGCSREGREGVCTCAHTA